MGGYYSWPIISDADGEGAMLQLPKPGEQWSVSTPGWLVFFGGDERLASFRRDFNAAMKKGSPKKTNQDFMECHVITVLITAQVSEAHLSKGVMETKN